VADAWWDALSCGQPQVLSAALVAAFADNPAPRHRRQRCRNRGCPDSDLPGVQVLPAKKAHVTSTGRLSSKAWTRTELNDVYSDLVGAHLLATIREAWAVGCFLTHLRIIGVRHDAGVPAVTLFDVDASRGQGHWDNYSWGSTVLQQAPGGPAAGETALRHQDLVTRCVRAQ
jgi:hypothetical protein